MSRARAETMPAVTVPPRAKGLPIASTQSPTFITSLSPNCTAVSGFSRLGEGRGGCAEQRRSHGEDERQGQSALRVAQAPVAGRTNKRTAHVGLLHCQSTGAMRKV